MKSASLAAVLTCGAMLLIMCDSGPLCRVGRRYLLAGLLAFSTAWCSLSSLAREPDHVAWPWVALVGAAPGLVFVVAGVAALRFGYLSIRSSLFLHRHVNALMLASRPLPSHPDVRVLETDLPVAYSVPGSGIIALSSSVLDRLDDEQFGLVIAHERAHLRLRDDRWLVAASAFSLIAPPMARRLALAVEARADCHAVRGTTTGTTSLLRMVEEWLGLADSARDDFVTSRGCRHENGSPRHPQGHTWWLALAVGATWALAMPYTHLVTGV